ncbi:unnamed protein product [Durusdinium trenchii]|uniref:Uncharacterized protein n=1 Tax=Durusdinium trenchii TaxID=1381693 RepID=A0ABP0JD09_9DINO
MAIRTRMRTLVALTWIPKSMAAMYVALGAGTVQLVLRLCSGVGQGGIDALASFPVSLTSLHLNFSCNSEIRSLASICQSIRGLAQSSLKLLDLDVSAVEKINDKSLILLAETLELSRLRNIFLSFRSCRALSDVGVEAVAGALPPQCHTPQAGFCRL